MAELYTIELMQGLLKLKEVPYMVTVMGMNFTTWLLQMREGVQRKSPLRFEVLLSTAGYKFQSVVEGLFSMAGYRFKSVVMSTVMEDEPI